MPIIKSRFSLVVLLCLIAAIGFGAGIVCARGAIPSMERVLRDYEGLVSDFNVAIDEVNNKKLKLSKEKRKEVDHELQKMQEQAEKEKEARDQANNIFKNLENIFGYAVAEDTAPVTGARRH